MLALIAATGVVGLANAKEQTSARVRVVSCPGRSFTFVFHPLLGASVRTGGRELVAVSAHGWTVSPACRSISRTQPFTSPAEPRFNVYHPLTLRCHVGTRLVIYLGAVRTQRGETLVGRNVVVASGDPARVVVGASLTNRPVSRRDRLGPFLYRNPANCLS